MRQHSSGSKVPYSTWEEGEVVLVVAAAVAIAADTVAARVIHTLISMLLITGQWVMS